MANQIIEDYRIISTMQLIGAIKEGVNYSERFCFILGSGASVSSGIPMGGELERRWMAEMEKYPGLAEVRATAEKLKAEKQLEYDFKEIEEAWQKAKNLGMPLSSEYYFDIYKLRFFPNHRNGYHYLEKLIADANPSFGYHPLALMLTGKGRNNLVITTNFDSLVEDALFMYTSSKPLVINHELLADYAGDPNISRPIIAKVHRGIFFDPLNMPKETDRLKDKWRKVLATVFQSYTPIVIGYGGGDNSLMEFLADKSVEMRNGIYWCYMEEYGIPNEKIQELVQQKKGWLVRTAGFDAIMLAMGNALFPDGIEPHETGKYLEERMKMQIENYEREYNKLIEREEHIKAMGVNRELNQSGDEFRKEIEKIADRSATSENEREKSNQMTTWDYWRQGNRYYNSREYESAIESYSNAITKQPDIAIFYYNRGTIYAEMGEKEKALSDYYKAIELKPDYEDAYCNRGSTYYVMGEKEKALSDYSKAIELKPDFEAAYINRGNAYFEMGEDEKAISDYSKAIELKPDDEAAYCDRGNTYRKMGEDEKAISDYSKAIELKPDYEAAYINRGYTYFEMGEDEKAISDYSKAIELKPDYEDAYNNRGYTYFEMGEKEKAISDFTKAIELKPDDGTVYYNRGNTYYFMGEKEKALSDYDKAIELKPDDGTVYCNRGTTYYIMGEKEKALSDCNKAIELKPDAEAAYNNRGIMYTDMGEKEKAISDFTKAIELNPEYKEAYLGRARVYRLIGEIEKAAADKEIAAKLEFLHKMHGSRGVGSSSSHFITYEMPFLSG